MATQTIDHSTLSRLVEAGAVCAASVIGQADGWALSVKYGVSERYLAAQRSGKLRLFRKLETVMLYLKNLGISHFDVDASGYDAAQVNSQHKRPDRAEALKRAHEAANHDAWFRKQVQSAMESSDQANAVFISHDVVMGNLKAKLDALATAVGNDE
ncbi:conserved hypothetical protein [Crenothrix polyspora]|uniref:Uncharacterized protein n=1 Tax=Crenothrix polyspora TaxID=360316 RepID=A0A1R4H5J9_9GAMM|nr:hypothetical protein [Crenothrix polyspora]SJM91548.1 conserved hypothetical protein [Crenothrix polyspora]